VTERGKTPALLADRGNSLRTSNANAAGGCFVGKGTVAFKVDLTRPGTPRASVPICVELTAGVDVIVGMDVGVRG
jgi:hypothetical protein